MSITATSTALRPTAARVRLSRLARSRALYDRLRHDVLALAARRGWSVTPEPGGDLLVHGHEADLAARLARGLAREAGGARLANAEAFVEPAAAPPPAPPPGNPPSAPQRAMTPKLAAAIEAKLEALPLGVLARPCALRLLTVPGTLYTAHAARLDAVRARFFPRVDIDPASDIALRLQYRVDLLTLADLLLRRPWLRGAIGLCLPNDHRHRPPPMLDPKRVVIEFPFARWRDAVAERLKKRGFRLAVTDVPLADLGARIPDLEAADYVRFEVAGRLPPLEPADLGALRALAPRTVVPVEPDPAVRALVRRAGLI